jgi:alpha-mannosidase
MTSRWTLRLAGVVLVLFPVVSAGSAKAASETVWQIGNFDGASIEFGKRIDYANPADDPVYVVGRSIATKDWPAYQPGSANGHAGYRPHPFTIEFFLPQTPNGSYVLKAAVLVDTPRIPRLQAEINGHKGWAYSHPKLDYRAGDPTGNSPTYTSETITLELPTSFLRQGTNKLILTAIDEPGERDDSVPPPGRLGDSGFFYDAVGLEHDGGTEFRSEEIGAEVLPTIFYKEKVGRLFEIVEVYVRFAEHLRGSVSFTAGSFTSAQEFKSDRDFGQEKLEFEVPESQVSEKGEVVVAANGKSISVPIQLSPGKKWNVFVVPHEHLDIGYSDYQAKTYEVQTRALDQAIDTIGKHPSFRYTLDGDFVAEQYLKTRSPEQGEKFLQLVRQNKINVPANYFNVLTGFASSEELIRSLYAGHRFNQEHGSGIDYASITDVPSYSWSYASVLAAAGVKYLVAASNNERAPVLRLGHLNTRSPFLWEGPDGGRIPMWYTQSYQQLPHIFGLPPQVSAGRDTLPIFLQHYSGKDYKSDGVIVYGTQWENTALFTSQAKLDEEWNKTYAYPKVKFSGFAEAMEYITGQAGDMPVIRGDGGPYWEDGIGSDAYFAAMDRQNQHRALSAEKFATISSYVNPNTRPDRETLNSMWDDLLLFDEHCWEADRSIQDPKSQLSIQQRAVKDSRAVEGKRLIDQTLQRDMSVIADSTDNPAGTVLVFNSLNWTRSALVETDLNKGLELVDLSTNQVVPYEVLSRGNQFIRIRFWAADVPSAGYKSYALRPKHAHNEAGATITAPVLENTYYRVQLDPKTGAVQSIFDKELNRELIDSSSPYGFNQYVYVTGADKEPNRLTRYAEVLPVPQMETHGANNGRLVSVTRTAFGTVARSSSSAVNTPSIETEIILPDATKAILFTNTVHKTKVYTKEGVYFAFPFASKHPEFSYETQNGYINPARDLLPGAGEEWFSVQHWIAVKDKDGDATAAIVPVDAPLAALGDIVRGTFPKEFGDRRGTIFSYAMNNYWTTNYVGGQGGDFVFRYVLASGKNLSPVGLSRLGWEAMTDLEVNEIFPQDRVDDAPRPLPAAQSSFLQVDRTNIVLTAWKEAEDKKGTILRFTELNGESSKVKVTTPIVDLQSAWICNAVEECKSPLPVSQHAFTFDIKPFQIVTLRIQGK